MRTVATLTIWVQVGLAAAGAEPVLPDKPQAYIPEPQPAPTKILVGAHHCPLWEADKPKMWDQVVKHPERTPALGFYSQENPEVADWETKWAVEHGISFFVYCWYRDGQGGPVKMRFGSAIHDALFRSRYASKIKFTIMWENQARGKAGVANEADLLGNLLPFWVQNYFRHPSYLKIDNKPLLFIYRPEFLVQDLGSAENVRTAFELGSKMLLLDNWNEWSEGHYIAPHREFGFGYLDAVRAVFSSAPKEHTDLLPEQIGMGPYDRAYKRHVEAGYRPAIP